MSPNLNPVELPDRGRADPQETPARASWGGSALAGLPHLLVGFWNALPAILSAVGLELPLIHTSAGVYFGVADLVLAGIILAALAWILLRGRRKGWRGIFAGRWPASWYGYGLLVAFAVLLQPLQAWASPHGSALTQAFLVMCAPLVLAALLCRLAWRDPLRALLVALPVTTFLWVQVLEFVPSAVRSPVSLGAWLLTALAAALIVRRGSVRAGMLLAAGNSLLVGLAFSAARASFEVRPEGRTDQVLPIPLDLAQFADYFAPSLLAVSALVLGPLLVWALGRFGKWRGTAEIWRFRLALAGLGLALGGSLGAFWIRTSTVSGLLATGLAFALLSNGLLLYLGLLLFLVGALSFGLPALRGLGLLDRLAFFLLILILFLLPYTAVAPHLFGYRFNIPGLPVAVYDLGVGQKSLAVLFSLAWLLLGSWLVTRPARKGRRLQAGG